MTVRQRYELHCHLDGSVRPRTLEELADSQGTPLAGPAVELAVAPGDVDSLAGFLPYIDPALEVLQSFDALRRVARELVEDWHRDGVVHGEARFAPQQHTRVDLGLEDAITAVAAGLADGESLTGTRTALVLCCLRHQSPDVSLQVAEVAAGRSDVDGLDLAGDESYAGRTHTEAFEIAHRAGLPVTVHAGEAAGPESVWEAIDVLGAHRVGHGVRSVTDAALVDRLVRDEIALECCPRCNVLTRAVPTMGAHPAGRLLRAGVRVTVSTDARTTAATTLDREFEALRATFGWGPDEHAQVQRNASAAAFGQRSR